MEILAKIPAVISTWHRQASKILAELAEFQAEISAWRRRVEKFSPRLSAKQAILSALDVYWQLERQAFSLTTNIPLTYLSTENPALIIYLHTLSIEAVQRPNLQAYLAQGFRVECTRRLDILLLCNGGCFCLVVQ